MRERRIVRSNAIHYCEGRSLGSSFFFSRRRRHTRWNCDWSSDVCSSDLERNRVAQGWDDDGDRCCCHLSGKAHGARARQDYIGIKLNQVLRSSWQVAGRLGYSGHYVKVAPLDVPELSHAIQKRLNPAHAFALSWRALSKNSDHRPFLRALGCCHTGPSRRAADERDELASAAH